MKTNEQSFPLLDLHNLPLLATFSQLILAHIRKEKMSQINYLEKENQIQPKVSRCQEIVNIRAEIDEVKKGKNKIESQ